MDPRKKVPASYCFGVTGGFLYLSSSLPPQQVGKYVSGAWQFPIGFLLAVNDLSYATKWWKSDKNKYKKLF